MWVVWFGVRSRGSGCRVLVSCCVGVNYCVLMWFRQNSSCMMILVMNDMVLFVMRSAT